jgi:hypothetical protein
MSNVEPTPPDSTRASNETFLRTWLIDRDEPCPLCGYNLRGLTSPRCPECWQALRLSVSLAEPYLKAWIALVAGLLPPAGIGAIFIFGFCYGLMHEGPRVFREFSDIQLGPGFIMLHVASCVPLSILAIVFRNRFLRLSRQIQKVYAIFAWIAVAVSTLILLSQIR